MRAFLFLLPLILIACNASSDDSATRASGDVDLREVTGQDMLAEIRAMDQDAVVLNAWATWCAPCIEEFPDFVRYSQEAPENVSVRFVSVDEDKDAAVGFLERHGVTGVSYLRAGDDLAFMRSVNPSWMGQIPVTFIFDRNGEIQDSWMGTTTFDQLRARVRRVVEAGAQS
jgi:thiol-disulfide isomerase/thioredoxin